MIEIAETGHHQKNFSATFYPLFISYGLDINQRCLIESLETSPGGILSRTTLQYAKAFFVSINSLFHFFDFLLNAAAACRLVVCGFELHFNNARYYKNWTALKNFRLGCFSFGRCF